MANDWEIQEFDTYSYIPPYPVDTQKRIRRNDLRAVAHYWTRVVAVIEATEKQEGFEIGAYLSVRDVAKFIGLTPALSNDRTGRRRHSKEQLEYVQGLINDIPRALLQLVGN